MIFRLRASNTANVGAGPEEAIHNRADPATPVDEGCGGGDDSGLRVSVSAAASDSDSDSETVSASILISQYHVTAVQQRLR